MTYKTRSAVGAAEKAVTRLVDECRKGGALYVQSPQAVAQVSRTSKWLLNASPGSAVNSARTTTTLLHSLLPFLGQALSSTDADLGRWGESGKEDFA